MVGNIDWIDLAQVRGKVRVLFWTRWRNGKRLSSQKWLCCMWLVGRSVGRLVRLVCCFVHSFFGLSVGWLIAWLVHWLDGWLVT